MTLTRWKVLAGTFGLSIGTLAAFAEAPKPTPTKGPTLPIDCPEVSLPKPAAPPVVTDIIPLIPTKVETPVLPLPAPIAIAPVEVKPQPAPAPRPAKPDPILTTFDVVLPVAAEAELPLPVKPSIPEPAPKPVAPPVPVAVQPLPALPPTPVNPVVQSAPIPEQTASTSPSPQPPSLAPGEKKLRVLLNMGDDRPKFEIRDGEETMLKVVCEKVDVKSPTDGWSLSTMKASGAVKFVTPGGVGVCDELTLTPGTGQVTVTGKVSFKYNWGTVETEVSGERMTFRLGSAPGMTPPAAAATTVPASYRR